MADRKRGSSVYAFPGWIRWFVPLGLLGMAGSLAALRLAGDSRLVAALAGSVSLILAVVPLAWLRRWHDPVRGPSTPVALGFAVLWFVVSLAAVMVFG